MDASIQGPEYYLKNSKEELTSAIRNSIDKVKIYRTRKIRKQKMGRKTTVWIFQTTN